MLSSRFADCCGADCSIASRECRQPLWIGRLNSITLNYDELSADSTGEQCRYFRSKFEQCALFALNTATRKSEDVSSTGTFE